MVVEINLFNQMQEEHYRALQRQRQDAQTILQLHETNQRQQLEVERLQRQLRQVQMQQQQQLEAERQQQETIRLQRLAQRQLVVQQHRFREIDPNGAKQVTRLSQDPLSISSTLHSGLALVYSVAIPRSAHPIAVQRPDEFLRLAALQQSPMLVASGNQSNSELASMHVINLGCIPDSDKKKQERVNKLLEGIQILQQECFHRNILPIYCMNSRNEAVTFITPPVDTSLDQYLAAKEKPAVPAVLQIFKGVAAALLHLHCDFPRSVIHNSLRPENVLLSTKGCNACVYVTGIGFYSFEGASVGSHQTTLIESETQESSLRFIAPEKRKVHFTNGHKDGRDKTNRTTAVDMYSFGVMLGEALHGMPHDVLYDPQEDETGKWESCFVQPFETNDIIDTITGKILLNGAQRSAVEQVLDLYKQCVKVESNERPTALDAVISLENACIAIAQMDESD